MGLGGFLREVDMRYRTALVIPALTPESEPVSAVVKVVPGIITEVELLFPAGHAGLTHVAIFYHERQIFPTSPEQSFCGDDHLITFNEQFAIIELPYELVVYGWNDDELYSHTVYVDLTVRELYTTQTSEATYAALPE